MSKPIGFDVPPSLSQGAYRMEGPVVEDWPTDPARGDLVTFRNRLWMYVGNDWWTDYFDRDIRMNSKNPDLTPEQYQI
jgi:hypothetical protein